MIVKWMQSRNVLPACVFLLGFFYIHRLHLLYTSQIGGESENPRDELETALIKASTPSKTVIIAMVNKAYVEGDKPMLDIFLDSFRIGEDTGHLVNNLLLVTMDQTSFNRCKSIELHCYKLETHGVKFNGEEAIYMSEDFIKMMWRRTSFLGEVLKRGYNFIFTDTDVMWLRNPFSRLIIDDDGDEPIDIQISTDYFNGDEWSQRNPINTGFYMIMSNDKTVMLFDSWYARKDNASGWKEQDVLNKMIREGVFDYLDMRVRFLDTMYFSGFCEGSRDVELVITVHANCCRTISAKVADLLAIVDEWKRFKDFGANNTSKFWSLQHEACANSWE